MTIMPRPRAVSRTRNRRPRLARAHQARLCAGAHRDRGHANVQSIGYDCCCTSPAAPHSAAAMRCARSALRITTSQRARHSRAPAGAPVGRRIRSPVRFECALRCVEVSAGRGARHFLSPYLVRAATGALAMVWIPPCTLAPRMFPTSSCLSQDHPPHAPRTIRAFETQ
jgi:hypothetical protein